MLLERAKKRKERAQKILNELSLTERCAQIGKVNLVGAYAYDLMVAHDIDIEVFCNEPRASHVFNLLTEIVDHPQIVEIKYHHYLNDAFNGLYFKILYQEENLETWNIDMWLFPNNHEGPLSRDLVKGMQESLTNEARKRILSIKEKLSQEGLSYSSILVYRAVLEDGIENFSQFTDWLAGQNVEQWTHWKPTSKGERQDGI